ncbi:MAG TPA: MYG1 family protein [Solirubrobacterales bacterium]|nr:MYG1 family protein [Solirubrobacterales bacterium]
MKVVTHSGRFHADEVFAIAVLRVVHGDFELSRTRDEQAIAESDIQVDIGGRDNAATGAYDHHQRGGAGKRRTGIPYASFGLVWKRYGSELCGSAAAAAKIDRILVQPIDAADNGYRLTKSLAAGVEPFTVSRLIASLNPLWDEDLDPAVQDRRFEVAVSLADQIIGRQVAVVAAEERAVPLLRAAINASPDPRIVELGQRLPWRPMISSAAPDALFVVCPYPDRWGVHAVPSRPGSFARRLDLPAAWAGLSGAELAEVSGVADAIFCHRGRHFASAGGRAGALALAGKAVEAAPSEVDRHG